MFDPDERVLLDAIKILSPDHPQGIPFGIETWAKITGLSPLALREAQAELHRTGVIRLLIDLHGEMLVCLSENYPK